VASSLMKASAAPKSKRRDFRPAVYLVALVA